MSDAAAAPLARADTLARSGDLHGAAEALEEFLARGKDDPAVRTRLGQIQRSLGDLDAALASFEQVHASAPNDVSRINLACALDAAGDTPRALALLDQSGTLLAASAQARWMAARVFLRAGDFRHGFALYEARWQLGRPELEPRRFARPRWQGAAAPGARLLVWHEQGLGDTLLALRFAAMANARGLAVCAQVQSTLRTRGVAAGGGPGHHAGCDAAALRLPHSRALPPICPRPRRGAGRARVAVPQPAGPETDEVARAAAAGQGLPHRPGLAFDGVSRRPRGHAVEAAAQSAAGLAGAAGGPARCGAGIAAGGTRQRGSQPRSRHGPYRPDRAYRRHGRYGRPDGPGRPGGGHRHVGSASGRRHGRAALRAAARRRGLALGGRHGAKPVVSGRAHLPADHAQRLARGYCTGSEETGPGDRLRGRPCRDTPPSRRLRTAGRPATPRPRTACPLPPTPRHPPPRRRA